MSKKAYFILMLCLILLLGGCSPGKADEAEPQESLTGTITLWTYFTDTEARLNDAFHTVYPHIDINMVPVPWADYDEKFRVTLAIGGDLPDIAMAESFWWGKWLAMDDTFEDLSQLGINPEDVSPAAAKAMKSHQGDFVVVPVSFGIGCLWYRKDLAHQILGINTEEEMQARLQTWDDFLTIGEEIKDYTGVKAYLFADTMSIEEFLVSADDAYLVGNTLNLTEHILPKFQLIETMLDNGYIAAFKGMEIDQSYTQGNIMFYPSADWLGEYIKGMDPNGTGKWGVVAPPGGSFFRGGHGYAIPKKSNADNKEMAAKRIGFVLTPLGSQTVIESNEFSACRDAFTEDILNTRDSYFQEYLTRQFHQWFIGIGTSLTYGEFDDIVDKEIRMQAYNMMETGIGAEAAIDNIRAELNRKLDGQIVIQ